MPGNNPFPPSPPETISWTSYLSSAGLGETPAAFNGIIKKRNKSIPKKVEDPNVPCVPNKGLTFGCDPEGFLFDKDKKMYIPAAGMIPGTKWEPSPVIGGAVQVDGMAVEFNTDPASTYDEWENNITGVIAQLEGMLPDHIEIHWVPSVEFTPEAFDKAPDDSKILGCDPDIDAYTGDTNPPPTMTNPYIRCAGGHLHFGFSEGEDLSDLQHLLNCQDVGKQADWYLGGWSYYHDPDTIRRQLYGKMGAIRYKNYGVEYRVLSNFWVPNEKLRREVWDRMVMTVNNLASHFIPDRVSKNFENELRRVINDHVMSPDFAMLTEFPFLTTNMGRANF